MSRAMELDSFHRLLERARAHSYPLSKRAKLFPSAAYRRSAPPQVALGRLKEMHVGMFQRRLGGFAAPKSELLFLIVGLYILNQRCWDDSMGLRYFRSIKRPAWVSYPRWPFMRAMRPSAEWRSFLFNWRFPTPDPRAVAPIVPRQ